MSRLLLLLAACAHATPPPSGTVSLPGAGTGVGLDYIAYDAANHRVWIPAAERIDVIDARTLEVKTIEGLATKTFEREGHKRVAGASSAAIGQGVAYVGNRADASVCAFDAATLAKRMCATLASPPDGMLAVGKELWVTTPRAKSIQVLDATTLAGIAAIQLDGEPEGFAVDPAKGLFFTNLEDKDLTLAIDLHTRTIQSEWSPSCGGDGPKGLAFANGHLVVVCPDHLETMDATGQIIAKLEVGGGLDSIDVRDGTIAAAAGKEAVLVWAALGLDGKLVELVRQPTEPGARNAVFGDAGAAFVGVGRTGRVLVLHR